MPSKKANKLPTKTRQKVQTLFFIRVQTFIQYIRKTNVMRGYMASYFQRVLFKTNIYIHGSYTRSGSLSGEEQTLTNDENTFISGNIKTRKSGSVRRNISVTVHWWLLFIYDVSDGRSFGDHF